MIRIVRYFTLVLLTLIFSCKTTSLNEILFEVSMQQPDSHTFQVKMTYTNRGDSIIQFKMPTWTPGYYQKLNFEEHVIHLKAKDGNGREILCEKSAANTWSVLATGVKQIHLTYQVKTTREFVATPFLDANRGYIIPGALFLYPAGEVHAPVRIKIIPYEDWSDIATGLPKDPQNKNTYLASNYDVLYDSPILIGNLSSLPSFDIQGIPHYFTGYQMEDIHDDSLMADLQKIVSEAAAMIGDIPYEQYTFIGIGPGRGGIEHLNSTTVSFSQKSIDTPQSRLKTLFFLAHEYFHHYNVKRIRPIELGPFDYEKGSKTKQLWISEGLSVYYEYLLVKRAGLCSEEQLLAALRDDIISFEYSSGKHFQTLAESSYNTWSDGPFGDGNNAFDQTISYYEKGPVVGLLLDFKIRTATNNQQSLDDVMKALYTQFYKKQDRGFTEAEFKRTCEQVTGVDIGDILEYVYSTKPLDYGTYPNAFGYQIDTLPQNIPGGWLGIRAETLNDTMRIKAVEWKSPAWEAGLRKGDTIIHTSIQEHQLNHWVLANHAAGEKITFLVSNNHGTSSISIILRQKKQAPYTLSRIEHPNEAQNMMMADWLGGTQR